MSFSNKPRTWVHLAVLCLCVGACMAMALLERSPALTGPAEGSDSLLRRGLHPTMQGPTAPPAGIHSPG